jgi:hypothetical protein
MIAIGSLTSRGRLGLAAVALMAASTSALAQPAPETYKATASVRNAAGKTVSVPVVISIAAWTVDGDRDKVVAAVKQGGTPGVQKQLASMHDAGFVQVGEVKTPLRFARSLPLGGGGKVITVATAKPVYYVGVGAPSAAKPADGAGYDVAVVIFQVDGAGKGEAGDFAPAAKVKFDERNAFMVEDYAAEAVRLTGISKK